MLNIEGIRNIEEILLQIKGKKIILFGTGSAAEDIVEYIKNNYGNTIQIAYCIDNNQEKWNHLFRNIVINKPEVLLKEELKDIAIIIASMYTEPIANQLCKMGFTRDIHFYEVYEDASRKIVNNFLSGPLPTGSLSIILGVAPCNHKCLFCPQSIEKPQKTKWMDLSLLEKVLHELPEEGIELTVCSYSETVAAPNLMPALKLMKKIRPKLGVSIATNGIFLTEKIVEELIDIGNLVHISFSFDAADCESYKVLMGMDNFHIAEDKLDMVCRIRNAKNSDLLIFTHIMGFENQQASFENFKRKWKNKVDRITFRNVTNWGDQTLGLEEQLANNGFVPVYKAPKQRYACASLFFSMTLDYDGDYYACCANFWSNPKKPDEQKKFSLGNATEITVKEAWNRMDWHRKKHLLGEWNECYRCATCDTWGIYPDITMVAKDTIKF